MQKTDHAWSGHRQKNGEAIGGEDRQRLTRDIRQKTVGAFEFSRSGEPRNHADFTTVNLLRAGKCRGKTLAAQNPEQGPRRPSIPLTPVRRKENNAQVFWKKAPLLSGPVWTPRTAIMISSGLEEASSAVSSVISPRLMRSTKA
jgi:hypothetical protein